MCSCSCHLKAEMEALEVYMEHAIKLYVNSVDAYVAALIAFADGIATVFTADLEQETNDHEL